MTVLWTVEKYEWIGRSMGVQPGPSGDRYLTDNATVVAVYTLRDRTVRFTHDLSQVPRVRDALNRYVFNPIGLELIPFQWAWYAVPRGTRWNPSTAIVFDATLEIDVRRKTIKQAKKRQREVAQAWETGQEQWRETKRLIKRWKNVAKNRDPLDQRTLEGLLNQTPGLDRPLAVEILPSPKAIGDRIAEEWPNGQGTHSGLFGRLNQQKTQCAAECPVILRKSDVLTRYRKCHWISTGTGQETEWELIHFASDLTTYGFSFPIAYQNQWELMVWADIHYRLLDRRMPPLLAALIKITRECYLWAIRENTVLVCDWPKSPLSRNAEGQVHRADGPALEFPDGWGIYVLRRTIVSPKTVWAPQDLTPQEIDEEENLESRRIMIEEFTPQRYLVEGNAQEIQRDDYGILWRREVPGDEPLVMVQVVNATPEPDGTYKEYFLRVPPHMKRAREAVAWTFQKDEADYAPAHQS